MGLEEEYAAWTSTQQLSKEYETWKASQAAEADRAQGGSIRQGTDRPFLNAPIGSLVGSTVGAVGGLAVGGPLGAVAGGAGGALVGELAQQGIETLAGSSAAPTTYHEAMRRATEETVMGGGFALLAPSARVARLAASPPTLEAGAEDAMRFMGQYTKQGYLPAEVTKSRKVDIMQNIAESSLFGGGPIKTFKENRDQLFNQIADTFVEEFGARAQPDEVGRAVVDAAKGNLEARTLPAKMIYQTLDTAASSATVNLKAMKESKEFERMVRLSQASAGMEGRTMGDELLKYVGNLPDAVPYDVAKEIRTRIRTLQSTLEKGVETKSAPAIGKAKHLYGQMTEAIRAGLSQQDPFLADMWDEANFIERAGQSQFNNRVIRTMIQKAVEEGGNKPEAIAKNLIQPNNISAIRTVKNAVDPSTWESVQSYALDKMMKESMKDGVIQGTALEQAMFGKSGLGESAMRTVFTPDQVRSYKQFINAMKVAQEKQSEGTGRVMIQLAQGGALMNVAAAALGQSERFVEESVGILLTPFMLSKLMVNPTTAEYLIRGVQTSPKSEYGVLAAGAIMNALWPRSGRTPLIKRQPNPKRTISAGPPAVENQY